MGYFISDKLRIAWWSSEYGEHKWDPEDRDFSTSLTREESHNAFPCRRASESEAWSAGLEFFRTPKPGEDPMLKHIDNFKDEVRYRIVYEIKLTLCNVCLSYNGLDNRTEYLKNYIYVLDNTTKYCLLTELKFLKKFIGNPNGSSDQQFQKIENSIYFQIQKMQTDLRQIINTVSQNQSLARDYMQKFNDNLTSVKDSIVQEVDALRDIMLSAQKQ